MKTLFLTTATLLLTTTGTFAQEAPVDPTVLPNAETGATTSPDTMNSDRGAVRYGAFGDRPVRELVGKNVLAEAGNDVGEVEALILEGDEVQAVVGVGGFLGIGEHDVAVPLADFVETDAGLMLPDMTEEDLAAMAAFEGTGTPLPMDTTVAGDPVEAVVLPGVDGTDPTIAPVPSDSN